MIKVIDLTEAKPITLNDYAGRADFAPPVGDIRAEATMIAPRLTGRNIWMINSTDMGGGVAEMMPRLVPLMRELGFSVHWAVIRSDNQRFFELTKRIHNLIHGDGSTSRDFSPEDARVYEAVNRENANSLKQHLGPHDILIVHDPQPLPLGDMLHKDLGLTTMWRCHIGLDRRTDATRSVWRFLRPYLGSYGHAVFSAPEYIPGFLAGRASILHPALDPMSHKNRELSVGKVVGVLCNAGLQEAHEPVPTPAYANPVKRLAPDGTYVVPGEFGLLFRPMILEVSRWDRLKGWLPLVDGFIRMKDMVRQGKASEERPRNQRRLELARLVCAGPDPSSIQDDPEGMAVFEQLRERYCSLDAETQADIAILMLPMASRKENALVVNALQRSASIIVQNSLQEGFGLTVTEGMWKRVAVLGTQACGIRQQIRDGIDGRLVKDPENSEEIATCLFEMLIDPAQRFLLGHRACRRVHESFLIFTQLKRYLRLLAEEHEHGL
jgi:trehalose synthase